MAKFFMDDHFPEHPKAMAAGDEACWLYTCGLAYVRRNKTAGSIPKPAAHRLVAKKGPALAKKLVEVVLWHDLGDRYQVHDYEEFNARSLKRQQQASAAAKARWSKEAAGDEQSESNAPGNADASNEQCPSHPSIQITKSSSDDVASDDDDDRPSLIDQALDVLARRDLKANPKPVSLPDRWLATARGQRLVRHRKQIPDIPTDLTAPEAVADWLDPPKLAAVTHIDRQQQAERQRHLQALEPLCLACDGTQWVDTPEGDVTRCPLCTKERTAP